jgi:hypothetical protein
VVRRSNGRTKTHILRHLTPIPPDCEIARQPRKIKPAVNADLANPSVHHNPARSRSPDPPRVVGGTELAATVFGPSYRRAAVMQAILALAATIGGIGAWFMIAGLTWLVGALLILIVVPFTLLVIRPTNQLLDPSRSNLHSSRRACSGSIFVDRRAGT